MLVLVTGTPGAGKSLYTVWEIARRVPGSTIEVEGEPRPRHLFSNIKDLALDSSPIGADQINTWHQWAKPGDVIVYDEVQEVWRPRPAGSKVPECIAALETHRHKGVDIVLITQHPLLVDPNIRRLVNQHLHLRRITARMAMVYEWDHCANISSIKGALQSKLWRHPAKGYELYKSAQAHTKPTQRLPRVVWVGAAALAAAAFAIPNAISRIQGNFSGGGAVAPVAAASAPARASSSAVAVPALVATSSPVAVPVAFPAAYSGQPPAAGCIVSPVKACQCYSLEGRLVDDDAVMCEALSSKPLVSADLIPDTPIQRPTDPSDLDVWRFMSSRRGNTSPSF